jgi:hypothetical protein
VSELWVPGYAGPLDKFVERIHRRIEQFAEDAKVEQAHVEVELTDGSHYNVETLSAEPGFGFVTLKLHSSNDVPDEVIVPVGSIKRVELSRAAEERGRLGFSLPST